MLSKDLPFQKEKAEAPESDNRTCKGTGSIIAEYNEVATVSAIVNDSDVEKNSIAITNTAFTGKGGDGIVIVTNMDNVLNIASKKSGSESL